jgi:2-oxoisovalerate dehydrogenase E2 component (dihydrolipoyl transacylase)
MPIHTIKLPDVGEGVAEAELVEWNVAPGDLVREDQVVAAVMTDKATVEIPSNAEGRVVWIAGKIGETLAVGADLIRIDIAGSTSGEAVESAPQAERPATVENPVSPVAVSSTEVEPAPKPEVRRQVVEQTRPLAAPSVRGRARNAGVDLHFVRGTGPAGRITHDDLDAYLEGGGWAAQAAAKPDGDRVSEIPVVGLRRKIAERMANAKRRIPHITIVEEVDVTALEELRGKLNGEERSDRPKLTLLPFLMAAMVKDRKSTRLNSSHRLTSRMPSSA